MLGKLRDILIKHKDILIYIFFGMLTTVVSFGVYFLLYNGTYLSATVSNAVSWVAAVVFAFLTNKPFVFHSHDWSAKTVSAEFVKFIGSRLGSLFVESMLIFAFVDLLQFDGNIVKLLTSVIVVVLNYLASKLLVFRKK